MDLHQFLFLVVFIPVFLCLGIVFDSYVLKYWFKHSQDEVNKFILDNLPSDVLTAIVLDVFIYVVFLRG